MANQNARILFPTYQLQKQIGNILIDAFISEDHEQSGSITRYPVEEGSDISDHIILDPDKLTIQGIVGPKELTEGSQFVNTTRSVFTDITNLRLSKTLVSVVTGLKVYENMFITNFSVPRTAQNGGSLLFNMSLEQSRIVSSQVVQIPKTQIAEDELQAQGRADIGKVTSGQTQAQTEDGTNFLDQIEPAVDATLSALGLGDI